MYFLAIDAGGTKTEVAVGDDSMVLARETGQSSKVTRVGESAAAENLRDVVFRVLTHAGLSARQISAACVGLSGNSVPRNHDWMRDALRKLVDCPANIIGDDEIAYSAAFGGDSGVLVISGTGSIAIGRSPQGQTARCGGWGPRFSDEGSANWIGELTVQKSVRLRDRGSEAHLLDSILKHLSMSDLKGLVAAQDSVNYASLFPIVVEAAHKGDLTAWYVLSEAGRELADVAVAAAEKLRLVRGTVCGAGSVFRHSALVRSSFRGALTANAAHLVYDEKLVEPVLGALAMARANAAGA
jgi:N-acetylglucosamine kinase-like BadF-type ATPase